jgi:hypothetical protein
LLELGDGLGLTLELELGVGEGFTPVEELAVGVGLGLLPGPVLPSDPPPLTPAERSVVPDWFPSSLTDFEQAVDKTTKRLNVTKDKLFIVLLSLY